MRHKYRLVRVKSPDAPQHEQSNNTVSSNNTSQNQEQIKERRPSRRHPFVWIVVTGLTIALIVVAGMWMSHVSSSLGHLNQVGATNSMNLSHESSQLAIIQMKLRAIGLQLNQLQSEVRSFFITIMNHFHHH